MGAAYARSVREERRTTYFDTNFADSKLACQSRDAPLFGVEFVETTNFFLGIKVRRRISRVRIKTRKNH
jgi:hypothetical protein